jgi:hypothetical protein
MGSGQTMMRLEYPPGWRTPAIGLILTMIVGVCVHAGVARWSEAGSVVKWDGVAYFLHARTLVIDRDLSLSADLADAQGKFDEFSVKDVRGYAYVSERTGRTKLPWPIGSGVVMAPFYAAGWVLERFAAAAHGRPPDSYGELPQRLFALGSLVYGWLGIWCSYLLCRRVGSSGGAVIAGAAMVLGGPLVFYMLVQPSMMHAASFGLFGLAALLWWRLWHEDARPLYVVFFGLIIGLLIAIRYQNAVFGVLLAGLAIRHW